ncbi:MAG: hypothetical protein WDO19_02510 [Bacteroidota bacterium]
MKQVLKAIAIHSVAVLQAYIFAQPACRTGRALNGGLILSGTQVKAKYWLPIIGTGLEKAIKPDT